MDSIGENSRRRSGSGLTMRSGIEISCVPTIPYDGRSKVMQLDHNNI